MGHSTLSDTVSQVIFRSDLGFNVGYFILLKTEILLPSISCFR